jgi:UDP-N-acetylmuramate--alanine ligase
MNVIELAAHEHKKVHFIGIGGIMMSALALELKRRGAVVSGSDRDDSDNVKMLRKAGITVQIGHDPAIINGVDIIVRNAAIKDSSPDIVRARELGLPILERPDVLGQLMREYRHAIGISGTHGKSTTSGMLTHALIAGGCRPTAFIGAALPEIGGAFTLGNKDYFVAESCEYCESFLYLHPETAVILNVEPDHLDYYSGIDAIVAAFRKFSLNTPENGRVVVNADNENAKRAVDGIPREIVTFGIENGDIRAGNIEMKNGYAAFDIENRSRKAGRVSLQVPGQHNISNALAVAAVMLSYGMPADAVVGGISSYTGILRRFQRLGTYRGAVIVDDYAHHPDELRATLMAAKGFGYRRIVCLFQPHTYSRTKALLDQFVGVLKLADTAVLTDIYSARETNIYGVSSKDIADRVPGAIYAPTLEEAAEVLRGFAEDGVIILTCGAGSVYRAAEILLK